MIRLRSRKLGEPARRGIEGDRLLLERRLDALDEAEEELEDEAEEDADDETSESESEEDEEEVEWSDLLETEESELEDDEEEDDEEERDRCFFFFLDDWPSLSIYDPSLAKSSFIFFVCMVADASSDLFVS